MLPLSPSSVSVSQFCHFFPSLNITLTHTHTPAPGTVTVPPSVVKRVTGSSPTACQEVVRQHRDNPKTHRALGGIEKNHDNNNNKNTQCFGFIWACVCWRVSFFESLTAVETNGQTRDDATAACHQVVVFGKNCTARHARLAGGPPERCRGFDQWVWPEESQTAKRAAKKIGSIVGSLATSDPERD